MRKTLITILALTLTTSALAQQIRAPRPSPSATLTQAIGITDMTIKYSRTGVKGRTISEYVSLPISEAVKEDGLGHTAVVETPVAVVACHAADLVDFLVPAAFECGISVEICVALDGGDGMIIAVERRLTPAFQFHVARQPFQPLALPFVIFQPGGQVRGLAPLCALRQELLGQRTRFAFCLCAHRGGEQV